MPPKGRAVAGPSNQTGSGSSTPRQERGRQPASQAGQVGQVGRTGTPIPGFRDLSLESRASSRASQRTLTASTASSSGSEEGSSSPGAEEEEDEEASELPDFDSVERSNVMELLNHINEHDFQEPPDVEAVYFTDPRFKEFLTTMMKNIYQKASESVALIRILRANVWGRELTLSLQSFAEERRVDLAEIIPFRSLSGDTTHFRLYAGDSRVPRTIVVLCKIRKALERAFDEVETQLDELAKNASSSARTNSMKAWIKSNDRWDARPFATPMFLSRSTFTPKDILDGAIYAKHRHNQWRDKYLEDLAPRAVARAIPTLSKKELLKTRVMHPDMTDFASMRSAEISALKFEPVEEPLLDWRRETLEQEAETIRAIFFKFAPKDHLIAVDEYNEQKRQQRVAHEDERKPLHNLKWSLALLAKNALILKQHCRDLAAQLGLAWRGRNT